MRANLLQKNVHTSLVVHTLLHANTMPILSRQA